MNDLENGTKKNGTVKGFVNFLDKSENLVIIP